MKEVEIENRIIEIKDGKSDFLMVDLIIEGEKIDSGDNPISSHSFWSDVQDASQRALYRIERENPKMSFDHNFRTMGMSEEEKEERFKSHIKENHSDVDVDGIFEAIDNEVKKIEMTGPDDNHPNPFLKFPINSQMTKNFIVCVVEEFLKDKESK